MRIAGPVCLSILVAACGKVEPPKYTVAMPERQTRLPNGMRVFLLPDPTTDLVEVDVRYQVGSMRTRPGVPAWPTSSST